MNFSFVNGDGGYTGFQDYSEPTRLRPTQGKTLNYSIWNTQNLGGQSPDQSQPFSGEGTGWQTRIAYEFSTNKTYHMKLALGPNGRDSTGTWWGVTVTDKSTGASQLVGQIKVPASWGKIKPSSSLFGEDANWNLTASGAVTQYDCSKFLKSTFSVDNLMMNGSIRPTSVSNTVSSGVSQPDGQFIKVATETCPAISTTINDATKGVRHTVNSLGTTGLINVVPVVTCDTSTEGVYLFVDINYQGACSKLTADAPSYTDLTIGGDTASSLKIVGPYQATLYQDPSFTGISSVFTTDVPNLGNYAVGNDLVSSVKVVKLTTTTTSTTPPPPPTTTPAPTPTPGPNLVDQATYVSGVLPPNSTRIGSTLTEQLTFKNSGTTTWRTSDGYELGIPVQASNNVWGIVRVPLPNDVAPGATVTFSFSLKAPLKTGTYISQWQMRTGTSGWFGDPSPSVSIRVKKR